MLQWSFELICYLIYHLSALKTRDFYPKHSFLRVVCFHSSHWLHGLRSPTCHHFGHFESSAAIWSAGKSVVILFMARNALSLQCSCSVSIKLHAVTEIALFLSCFCSYCKAPAYLPCSPSLSEDTGPKKLSLLYNIWGKTYESAVTWNNLNSWHLSVEVSNVQGPQSTDLIFLKPLY